MKKVLLASFFVLAASSASFAQCAMCKATAESNLQGGGGEADGLNEGILYLMAFPYILVGAVGYFWYKHNKRSKANPSL